MDAGAGLHNAASFIRTCSRSFRGRTSTLPGWNARRGAQPIARLLASAATPQTARQGTCPQGWSEIGRLHAPAACMGAGPCGAPGASTPPDCTPMRPPKNIEQALRGAPSRGRTGTPLFRKAADFKSAVSTNFTIGAPAAGRTPALQRNRGGACAQCPAYLSHPTAGQAGMHPPQHQEKREAEASLSNLEREKSLELSTSTLARLRSTN